MAYKNTIALISNSVGYYLTGGHTPYTGSGTPWTSEATSPYELSATENSWTPTSAPGTLLATGGQPFTPGATPIYLGYETVRETVGIQCRGSTKDNAIALLRQLRAIVSRGVSDTPTILSVTGGTNTAYYEIQQADVQESASYITDSGAGVLLRCTVTWTRTIFGGQQSSGETLINAVSMSDNAVGTPDTVEAYSAGSGDLIWEGSPLNVTLSTGVISGQSISQAWLASVYGVAGSTTGAASFTAVSTTASLANFDVSAAAARPGLRARAVALMSASIANRCYATLYVYTSSSLDALLYQSERLPIPTSATLMDFGPIPIADAPTTTLAMRLVVEVDSTTAVLTHTEYLLYYDYATIVYSPLGAVTGTTSTMTLTTFRATSGLPCLPYRAPRATGHAGVATVYGSVPRYFSGASLWANVAVASLVDTSRTFTATVTHAPLWRTLRGAT